GLPLLQATRRADEEAARHLAQVRRQAEILVAREQSEVRDRLARAAADLAASRSAAAPLRQGPASAARALSRLLADRHALALLETRSAWGSLLATASAGAAPPLRLGTDEFADGGIALVDVPLAALPPPPEQPPGAEPHISDAAGADNPPADDADAL